MPLSEAELLVRRINLDDIQHRKGWRYSERPHPFDVIPDLRKEVAELSEALILGETQRAMPDINEQGAASAKDELADVFACVLQIAYRLNITFAELDAEAVRKLTLRFPGAS